MDCLADVEVADGDSVAVVGSISTVAMFIDSTCWSTVPGFVAGCVKCRVLIGDLAAENVVFYDTCYVRSYLGVLSLPDSLAVSVFF